jgi:imidazolonepropionase-like amidohydrolase
MRKKDGQMNTMIKIIFPVMLGLGLALPTLAADDPAAKVAPKATLIKNVHVFDGVNEKRIENASVLVEGSLIKTITTKAIKAEGATVIDGGGRTLIPGLLDAHAHITVNDNFESLIYDHPQVYVGAMAAANARAMLLRGFTTIRDVGGPSVGLKMAIDQGAIEGPRILPSGAFISQTSGHGDFDSRLSYQSPYFTGATNLAVINGWAIIADGVPEVQKATREVLRSGATQIKIMASGSVTGAHDPLDVTEYTLEEMKAIVKEAEKWGTYAMVHAYSDEAVRNAVLAGVKCVSHGLFASEETMKLIKEKDVWFDTQFLAFSVSPEVAGVAGTPAEPKFLEAEKGAKEGFERAKKLGLKMAFGMDTFGSLEIQALQSKEFLARSAYFTPHEILQQATSNNAELLMLSGKRHPYQDGPLGVIKEGAYADVLLVDGNPLEDISLLADPEKNLKVIMKDGKIYKNTL